MLIQVVDGGCCGFQEEASLGEWRCQDSLLVLNEVTSSSASAASLAASISSSLPSEFADCPAVS